MAQGSMTALVSAFSRAYHSINNEVRIFDDSTARLLLTSEEYGQISKSMAEGIHFFHPSFAGSSDAALRWVVDNHLSPSPLGRAAFAEKALETAVSIGAKQYLILGAGYDTFAYRQPDWADGIQIFEIDQAATSEDKRRRLENAGLMTPENVQHLVADFSKKHWQTVLTRNALFHSKRITFCSLLGVSYYLSIQTFEELLSALSAILSRGSSIVFDYPDENSYTEKAGVRAKKQALLAQAAKESMLACYSYEEMEALLSAHGFLIYEHLTPLDMTRQYFAAYNQTNPRHTMTAFDNVNYCLAVKR